MAGVRISVYLSEDEAERLREIGRRHHAGASTMIHLAVKALLGDPLPEWAEAILAELCETA